MFYKKTLVQLYMYGYIFIYRFCIYTFNYSYIERKVLINYITRVKKCVRFDIHKPDFYIYYYKYYKSISLSMSLFYFYKCKYINLY